MFSHSGQAQLVYANGETVDLDNVRLLETQVMPGGLKQWSGTATADRPADAGEAQIQLPNGDTGNVVVDFRGRANAHEIRVDVGLLGSGPPPGHTD